MSATKQTGEKRERRDRAIVSLSDETKSQVDTLAKRAAEQMREAIGVGVEPKRSDVIAACVKQAYEGQNGAQ